MEPGWRPPRLPGAGGSRSLRGRGGAQGTGADRTPDHPHRLPRRRDRHARAPDAPVGRRSAPGGAAPSADQRRLRREGAGLGAGWRLARLQRRHGPRRQHRAPLLHLSGGERRRQGPPARIAARRCDATRRVARRPLGRLPRRERAGPGRAHAGRAVGRGRARRHAAAVERLARPLDRRRRLGRHDPGGGRAGPALAVTRRAAGPGRAGRPQPSLSDFARRQGAAARRPGSGGGRRAGDRRWSRGAERRPRPPCGRGLRPRRRGDAPAGPAAPDHPERVSLAGALPAPPLGRAVGRRAGRVDAGLARLSRRRRRPGAADHRPAPRGPGGRLGARRHHGQHHALRRRLSGADAQHSRLGRLRDGMGARDSRAMGRSRRR